MTRDVYGRPVEKQRDEKGQFASNVLGVAKATETKPFRTKAAISDVYDNYGKKHADAGSMDSFKARLLQSHNAGHLTLLPMENPGAIAAETVKRSAMKTQDGTVHMIHRGIE